MAASQRNNILHNYANHTYNLQLWAITKDDFNKVSDGIQVGKEDAIIQSGELLISNGGFSQSDARSQFFTDIDMAIDNLEIETIVGNKGKMARGTDAIMLKFDIIEPFTVTLLDRLIRVAKVKAQGQDFKSLIYCLKIQFFGYNDDGTIATIPATKWFPITLLNMKFNITQKGALYNVQAVPAHQLVMTQINNTIPFHIELQGQTIGDLFNGDALETVNVGGSNPRTDTTSVPNGASTSVIKSIVKALNDNEKFKVSQKSQKYPNEYKFDIDPDLKAAKVVDPANMPNNSFVFAPIQGADGQAARYQAQAGTLKIDNVNGAFRTQAGTSITDFIQSIFIVTDFMRNQVTLNAGDQSKPFVGVKIVPKMKVLNYDPITKNYQREITFSVRKFEYTGLDHESMPQKPPSDADVVKNYEYIFTGNNKDVRNVSLNYQMAFFETRIASKISVAENSNDGINDDTTVVNDTEADGGSDNTAPRLGQPGRNPVALIANRTNSGGVQTDTKSLTVSEMMSHLFDNIADTISLDIEIVGDPDWIQQDNVLYADGLPKDQKIVSNGVINFQNNITHFQFTFKSPTTDYDPITGLMDVSNSSTAIFSGKYHVITVTSSFRKGKFTQKLTNNRIRIQDTSQLPKKKKPPVNDGRQVTPGPDDFSLDYTRYPDTGRPPR